MARGRSVSGESLDAASILQRVDLARRLLALAVEQSRQAALNTGLAQVGLAELIADLDRLGVKS